MTPDRDIDIKEYGEFIQAVRTLTSGFAEMRQDFRSLEAKVGRRCSDCALNGGLLNLKEWVKTNGSRIDSIEGRLRFLEVKVAGLAVVCSAAAAYITHLLLGL